MQYKCILSVSGLTSAWIHITSSCLRRVQRCGMCGALMETSFMKFHEEHSVEIWWSGFDIPQAMKAVSQARTNGIIAVDVSSDGSFFATLSASKCPPAYGHFTENVVFKSDSSELQVMGITQWCFTSCQGCYKPLRHRRNPNKPLKGCEEEQTSLLVYLAAVSADMLQELSIWDMVLGNEPLCTASVASDDLQVKIS